MRKMSIDPKSKFFVPLNQTRGRYKNKYNATIEQLNEINRGSNSTVSKNRYRDNKDAFAD